MGGVRGGGRGGGGIEDCMNKMRLTNGRDHITIITPITELSQHKVLVSFINLNT